MVFITVAKSAAAATAALKKTLAAVSKESGSQTPSTSRQQPTPSTSVVKVSLSVFPVYLFRVRTHP